MRQIGRLKHLLLGGLIPTRQSVHSAASLFLPNAISKVLMLLVNVMLARLLGASNYGIYATAIAIVLLLSVPSSLGLPILVIRLVPAYQVGKQWGLMRGLLRQANRAVLFVSVGVATVGALAVLRHDDVCSKDCINAFWWAMALLPLITLGALRSVTLRGLRYHVAGQVPEYLIIPAGLLAMIMAIWAIDVEAIRTPDIAVLLRCIATFAAVLVGIWLLHQRLPNDLRDGQLEYDSASWFRSARLLLALGSLSVISLHTDILMLATLRGSESAGIYQAAARGAELVAFSLIVANFYMQPIMSALHAARDMQRLQRVITAGVRITLAITLPISIVLILFAQPILVFVFGDEFRRGAVCLSILCISQIASAAMGSGDQVLNMTGHERDTVWAMAAGAGANIGLNFALIPIFDIEGAAIGTGVSLVLWKAILIWRVRQRLGISCTAVGRLSPT